MNGWDYFVIAWLVILAGLVAFWWELIGGPLLFGPRDDDDGGPG